MQLIAIDYFFVQGPTQPESPVSEPSIRQESSGTQSGVQSGTQSGTQSGVQSGTQSGTQSGVQSGTQSESEESRPTDHQYEEIR